METAARSRQESGRNPLFDLIWTETKGQRVKLILALMISGLSNAGILVIINLASERSNEGPSLRLLLMFSVALIAYIVCQRFTFTADVRILESTIERIRVRLSNKIRHAELSTVGVVRSEIFDAMTRETLLIGQAAARLSGTVQFAVLGFFVAVYIAVLSLPALILIIILLTIGLSVYWKKQDAAREFIRTATKAEIAFVDVVSHSLDGFKEARLNARRGIDLHRELASRADVVKDVKIKVTDLYSANYILFQSMFYLLLAAIAFILPRYVTSYGKVVNEISTAILFISGSVFLMFESIPFITQASVAALKIRRLEGTLDELGLRTEEAGEELLPAIPSSFREIELTCVEYSYKGAGGERFFTVGPVSLKIRAGETLFLVGGNGSGKSSLLYLMTALFEPDSGHILLDGKLVTEQNVQQYRELFSAIFSDFHLFDRLYGLLGIDKRRVRDLLVKMQLEDKTSFENDRFCNLDLSTGQRKRLALVVTLLDDRPIFVFDELAADQDPVFRKYLYKELLQELKNEGKTIIAVSHDDKYFHVADRVLKMDFGKFVPYDS